MDDPAALNRRIRAAAMFLVALLALVGLNLAYIQVIRAGELAVHPRNPRTILDALKVRRGQILTADEVLLAESVRNGEYYRRSYPEGDLYSNIVGYFDLRLGTAGAERTFSETLVGKQDIASLDDYVEFLTGKTEAGNDIVLTIDSRLQQAAADALGPHRGAVVALDPRSGQVLAMVTNPRYDPNTVERGWKELNADPSRPLLDRSRQGLYPPGSTFKIVTASGALEKGVTEVDTTWSGPSQVTIYGGKVKSYGGYSFGTVEFHTAFAKSINTVFGQIGDKMGAELLVSYASRFGLNHRPPFELTVAKSTTAKASEMDSLEAAWTAVGQGRTLVTPLQMALIGAAIANEGRIPEPHILLRVESPKGAILRRSGPSTWRRAIRTTTAKTVKELMVETVREGTGRAASLPDVQVAGKTGTAEHAHGESPHAWFVAFAPAEKPEIVVSCIVEEGGTGGAAAAPIVKRVLESYFSQNTEEE